MKLSAADYVAAEAGELELELNEDAREYFLGD